MIVLDRMLVGGLRFVLDKLVVAVELELEDVTHLREELLVAEMQLETGEITAGEFAARERVLLDRLRELALAERGDDGDLVITFFGGKGGVGKTTCAAAAAIDAAAAGKRVLVVSTDPAHSLGDALGVGLGPRPRRVPTRRGQLWALELDADRALDRWLRARRDALGDIAERGTLLDRDDVDSFLCLSFPGVDELIGLVELERISDARRYDEIVVDAAPTGHLLRLLETPEALAQMAAVLDRLLDKERVLAEALGGRRRRDACDELIDDLSESGQGLREALRDRARATFRWVMIPEPMALAETEDALAALDAAGIAIAEVIVNRVVRASPGCPTCAARVAAERACLDAIARRLPGTPIAVLAESDHEPRGIAALRAMAAALRGRAPLGRTRRRSARRAAPVPRVSAAAPADLDVGGARLILFGGKGGVGKTTCAAATAVALARRGQRTLLLSTDPAHSLGDALGIAIGDRERTVPGVPGLVARELDATAAFVTWRERYRDAVDDVFDRLLGGRLDATYDRRAAHELIDLAPPGLDEVFGMTTVIDALFGGAARFDRVIVDTAPTGHALRLLEMPSRAQAWVKALLRLLLKYRDTVGIGRLATDLLALSRDLGRLAVALADDGEVRFVAVTRAAGLPRLETERLLQALDRLGVAVAAVVVNGMPPMIGCQRCRRGARAASRELDLLERALARRRRPCEVVIAPLVSSSLAGAPALRAFHRSWEARS